MLVLRLAAPEKRDVNYALFSRDGLTAPWQTATWDDALNVIKNSRPIIVLIPSREVLLTTATVKTRNQRQLAQALPFALEEQLLHDPELQHYVWHSINTEEGLNQVAVIEHQRLQQWLDFLHHNGIAPLAILPDFAALPLTEGHQTAWLTDQGLWVRQSTLSGYYASLSTWSLQLNHWLGTGTEDNPIHIRVLEGTLTLPESDHLFVAYDSLEQAQVLHRADIQSTFPLNLIKGFKTQAHSQLTNLWQKWQSVAWAGAITGLMALTLQGLEIRQLQQETDQLQADNIAQFKQLFPQAGEVDPALNLSSLIQSEIKKSQGRTQSTHMPLSALPLLKTLAQVLPQQPITLQTINWNQNKIIVRFTSESTAVIPELEKSLSTVLNREVSINYQRDANKVVGEFSLAAEPTV